jgi:alpha-mannosidase
MNGTDHMEPRADLPLRMRAADAAFRGDDTVAGDAVRHSTLPAYLDAVRAELGEEGLASLPQRQGELRSAQRAHLLPAVLSARMWTKQANARCEALLTRWAEPFSALAEQVAPGTDQRGFLRQAWTWLLQNHPHDSICGCSVDQVHCEMETRFSWSEQIAEQVTLASLETLARHIDTQQTQQPPPASQHATRLVVFNPTTHARTDRVSARLRPAPQGEWHLVDANGQPVPYRILGRAGREHYGAPMSREALVGWATQIGERGGRVLGDLSFRGLKAWVEGHVGHLEVSVGRGPQASGAGASDPPVSDLADLQTLLADEQIESFYVRAIEEQSLDLEFLARDVPALGYTQVLVSPGQGPTPELRLSEDGSPTSIENEFLRVEAAVMDGTLTVTDKVTALVLAGANRFVDGGDRGDEYTYCAPEHDTVVDTPTAPPHIRRLEDGLGSALEIGMVYRLPCSLAAEDRSHRSGGPGAPSDGGLVDLPITSRITLVPGLRRVEFETTVDNQAEDHRLRVHFPTPIVTDRSWADGHFDVIERPIARPTGTADWAEQPVGDHPQLTFVDVSDGQQGVLLANRGLPEYEALPGGEGSPGVTLALTLLRCVGWLSRGDLHNRDGHAGPDEPTPQAQCPGQHTFHYALVPHTGNYLTAMHEAQAFNAPLRAVCTDIHGGPLPPRGSFVEVSPAAVALSAIKPPEEGQGLVVRVYNAAPVAVEARLKLWGTFRQAVLVSLSEERALRTLAEDTDTVTLPLRAKQIATLRFGFDAE